MYVDHVAEFYIRICVAFIFTSEDPCRAYKTSSVSWTHLATFQIHGSNWKRCAPRLNRMPKYSFLIASAKQ